MSELALTKPEKELILYWRSFVNGLLEITYQDSAPLTAKAILGSFMARQTPNGEKPLDQAEQEILLVGRDIGWGHLALEVTNGSPFLRLAESYQSVRFSPVNEKPKKTKKL